MNRYTTRQYETFMRVQGFAAEHAALFPAGSLGAAALGDLGEVVAEMTTQEVARRGAKGEGRHTRAGARAALVRTLTRMRQTAQLLTMEDARAGDSFLTGRKLPGLNDRSLLQAARTCAVDAAPLAAGFIRHGMPETFAADLQAEIDDFARALDLRQQGRATTGEAQSRIRAAIVRGQLAGRRLDAFLANTLEHDDPLLAAWKGIRRIGPAARSQRAEAVAEAPAVPPNTGEVIRKQEAA